MSKLVKAYLGIGMAIAGIGSAETKRRKPETWKSYSLNAKAEAIAAIILGWPIYVMKVWRGRNESDS